MTRKTSGWSRIAVGEHERGRNPALRPILFAVLLALAFTTPAHPQGCSDCRESLNQTPMRTQTAYRRAIVLMVLAGTGVFSAALLALRRFH